MTSLTYGVDERVKMQSLENMLKLNYLLNSNRLLLLWSDIKKPHGNHKTKIQN